MQVEQIYRHEETDMTVKDATNQKPRNPKAKPYDPKYEKSRKQKPVSFSLLDAVQVRLLEFIAKFEYGVYFKNILAQLNDAEQQRIIEGDLNTIPSALIKQNIINSKGKVSDYFTAVDATREFDHNDLAKHLTDDALLKELANRNLAPITEPTPIYDTPYSVRGAQRLTSMTKGASSLGGMQMPVVNEEGFVEVRNEDGTVRFIEAEHYADFVSQHYV